MFICPTALRCGPPGYRFWGSRGSRRTNSLPLSKFDYKTRQRRSWLDCVVLRKPKPACPLVFANNCEMSPIVMMTNCISEIPFLPPLALGTANFRCFSSAIIMTRSVDCGEREAGRVNPRSDEIPSDRRGQTLRLGSGGTMIMESD